MPASSLTALQRELYKRNLLLEGVGESGQRRLVGGRVLVVGLGGLGSPAALYLAASGVGEIGLLDSDVVELSNLQRQILHGRPDLGRTKTGSARDSLSRLNPDVRLVTHQVRLDSDNGRNLLADYDFVIEATDNFEAKFLVNDLCLELGKPFSHAGILGFFGQTLTVVPGQGPCLRCVFQDVPRPGTYQTTDQAGVLGGVAGVLGILQATEALKWLLGLGRPLTGRLLTFDALDLAFREVELPREPSCVLCRALGETRTVTTNPPGE